MGAGRREFLYSMADLPPTLLVIVREKTGARQVPQNARVPHLCVSTGLLARKSLCLLFGNYSEPSCRREFSRSLINGQHLALSECPVRRHNCTWESLRRASISCCLARATPSDVQS